MSLLGECKLLGSMNLQLLYLSGCILTIGLKLLSRTRTFQSNKFIRPLPFRIHLPQRIFQIGLKLHQFRSGTLFSEEPTCQGSDDRHRACNYYKCHHILYVSSANLHKKHKRNENNRQHS